MTRKLVFAAILAMAGIFLFSGVSLAGLCSDLGKEAGCVRSVDIKNEHVRSPDILPDAITGTKIKDGTIRRRDLADEAVNSAKVLNQSLTGSDLATDSVGGDELIEDIVLGDAANNGSLVVQASNLRNYLAASGTTTNGGVVVGQSGGTGMDVDFYVYDPTESDHAAYIDASRALLRLGSGTAADPGDDGDIWVEDGEGNLVVDIDGNRGLLTLGGGSVATPGNDGDLWVKNNEGTNTVEIDGRTGTATNSLSGNGFVKAWAKIEWDGTVIDCWRCNRDTSFTYRRNPGWYYVDFTPLATDIRTRPKSIVVSDSSQGHAAYQNSSDRSQIIVWIRDDLNEGMLWSSGFDVIIY